MTLFSPIHATKVLALLAAMTMAAIPAAQAGELHRRSAFESAGFDGGHKRHWKKHRHDARHHDRRWRGDRHDRHRAGNFYGGAISAWRDRGNGTYFYIERDGPDRRGLASDADAARVKIIDITRGDNGCAWEAGVCVVRP